MTTTTDTAEARVTRWLDAARTPATPHDDRTPAQRFDGCLHDMAAGGYFLPAAVVSGVRAALGGEG